MKVYRSIGVALLVLISLFLCVAFARADAPKSAPDPRVSQGPTPEQVANAFKSLAPGDWKWSNEDGGWVKTRDEGTGKGAGAIAEGDKLDGKFDGTPPKVGRGSDGSQTAEGGSSNSTQKAQAFIPPAGSVSNPFLWLGLALIVGGGSVAAYGTKALKPGLVKGGFAAVGSGIVSLACVVFPAILIWAVVGLIAVFAFLLIKALHDHSTVQEEARKYLESTRALAGAFTHPLVTSLPAESQAAIKNAITKESDATDRATIAHVIASDAGQAHAE